MYRIAGKRAVAITLTTHGLLPSTPVRTEMGPNRYRTCRGNRAARSPSQSPPRRRAVSLAAKAIPTSIRGGKISPFQHRVSPTVGPHRASISRRSISAAQRRQHDQDAHAVGVRAMARVVLVYFDENREAEHRDEHRMPPASQSPQAGAKNKAYTIRRGKHHVAAPEPSSRPKNPKRAPR